MGKEECEGERRVRKRGREKEREGEREREFHLICMPNRALNRKMGKHGIDFVRLQFDAQVCKRCCKFDRVKLCFLSV